MKWVVQAPRIEVEAGLDQVLWNSPVIWMPGVGSYILGNCFPHHFAQAMLYHKPQKRRYHNSRCAPTQDLSAATAIPRESNEVSSFFMGMVPTLEKSSSAAQGHPALKQRFPPAFRVEAAANTSPASCQRTAEANRAPRCFLQQTNTAASTYSLHLHTQCRGFFLRVLMSPFSSCF